MWIVSIKKILPTLILVIHVEFWPFCISTNNPWFGFTLDYTGTTLGSYWHEAERKQTYGVWLNDIFSLLKTLVLGEKQALKLLRHFRLNFALKIHSEWARMPFFKSRNCHKTKQVDKLEIIVHCICREQNIPLTWKACYWKKGAIPRFNLLYTVLVGTDFTLTGL